MVKGVLTTAIVVSIVGFAVYAGFSKTPLAEILPGFEGPSTRAATMSEKGSSARGVTFLGSSNSLDGRNFEGTEVGGLSALAYDPRRELYYSLIDREIPSRFYTMRLPLNRAKLGKPKIFYVTPLLDSNGRSFNGARLDGEGIALTSGGEIFVSSETEPSIRRFSLDGRSLSRLPVPKKFLIAPDGRGKPNSTFEALSLSSDYPALFTMTQEPLVSDGEDPAGRKRIRVLRYDRVGENGYGYRPTTEYFYLTESDQGIAEIVATSSNKLLVLERGQKIFQVSLKGAEDVSNRERLDAPGLKPLEKKLLVDLSNCPKGADGYTPDNYEAMALGPMLSSGRRALLLQSDDGFSAQNVTRVLALGLGKPQSSGIGECD